MNHCNTCKTLVEFKRVYDIRLLFLVSLSGSLFIIPVFYHPIILILVPFPAILYYFYLPIVCPQCENPKI